jgi:PIN domain nuclease of toxin-antitoxin system
LSVILDASAVLASLFGEAGADEVDADIHRSMISTINLAEVAQRLARNGRGDDEVSEIVTQLPCSVVPLASSTAIMAGLMQKATRFAGLSIGDRACLSLARELNLPVLTADREWLRVAEVLGVKVRLIR